MIPITKSTSPEPYIRKPKTPPEEENPLLHRKNSFNSFLSHASFHHSRSFLFLSVLFFQILIFLAVRSFPVSVSHHSAANTIAATTETTAAANIAAAPVTSSVGPSRQDNQCSYGKIFVYDLPSSFNREIIDNCDKLNPWGSKCDALSNDGFGREATGISRVVPENLAPAWYWTDQFVSEIIFHNRILNHKCRTLEADNATAFYVPFYVGLAVDKYLWTNSSAEERDQHCEMVLSWLNDQPYFKKSNGWDHFMTMGRITWDFRRSKDHDWGSSCIYKPGMRNITRLLIERNPWDYFDVGVPYPSGFHPRSDSDIIKWQEFVRTHNRSTLFCFAGATRGAIQNDFRSLLLSQCYKESGSCKVVDCAGSKCSNGSSAILETFLDSDFCLQPRGDSFTRRSIFDCMVAGSIPVLFWKRSAYYQYEWFLPSDSRSFSVFIDRNEVKNGTSIREVLESFSKEEVRKMREKVIEYIPKFVYARPHQGLETIKDAFDVAIDGVLNRVKEQENWYKW